MKKFLATAVLVGLAVLPVRAQLAEKEADIKRAVPYEKAKRDQPGITLEEYNQGITALARELLGMPPLPTLNGRNWHQGTWLDADSATKVAGGQIETFAIETDDDRVVVASRSVDAQSGLIGRYPTPKPIPMTVDNDVFFAIQGTTLYVIGEDEKEYSLVITKKILKTPTPSEQ